MLLLLFNQPAGASISATATQSFAIGQDAAASGGGIGAFAVQSLSIGQAAPGTVLVKGLAAQSLSMRQAAVGNTGGDTQVDSPRVVAVPAELRLVVLAA